MLHDYVEKQLLAHFSFVPTDNQKSAFRELAKFITSETEVFIMNGYAGTGKTTLVRALIETLQSLETPYALLAPTGRSAKVLSNYTKGTALTIHKKIYRQRSVTDGVQKFGMNFNAAQHTIYIVDEASMLSDTTGENALFGSGSVLNDLFRFVFNEHSCKLILIGDTAQLPPIGVVESPALDADYIERNFLKKTATVTLTQIIRQAEDSGILTDATNIRNHIENEDITIPKLKTFDDVEQIDGSMLLDALESSHNKVGIQDTIVITRTNKLANRYNAGIRNRILWKDSTVSKGDYIMIVKNNYFWTEQQKVSLDFLANGDRARVRRVRNFRSLYGLRFADVSIILPDYDDVELTCTVILDSLRSDSPSLTREQSEALFQGVSDDYADVAVKHDRMMKIRDDAYYTALQVKYAYAVTCHKAQGGQWEHVYVDQGYMTDDMVTPEYLHWLYTAFTRATQTLFLVNWPKTQTIDA